MGTGVAVQDIQVMNLVEKVFLRVRGKYVCYARVEAGTKDCDKTFFFKSIMVSPLPAILKVSNIRGFIIGGIHIMDPRFQTRIHDVQILIGEGEIEDNIRLK